MKSFLAGGPATFSRDVRRFVYGTPRYALSGQGQWVYLSNSQRYFDLPLALGACPLGYAFAEVTTAVEPVIRGGHLFTLSMVTEEHVAGKLCNLLGFDRCRFVKTGSDAVCGAVRLARAVTGRRKVLVERNAYHGQHIQWKLPARGVVDLEYYVEFSWDRMEEDLNTVPWKELACVLVEYPVDDVSDKMTHLRELAREHGVLFVLDEVVTGLRWISHSVNSALKLEADLVCLGKALGNGFSIGAILGNRYLMREFDPPDPVFLSTTFGTEATGFAAASVVLSKCWSTPSLYERLEEIGRRMMECIPENAYIEVVGVPSRHLHRARIDSEHKWLWDLALLSEHVLSNRPVFPSIAIVGEDLEFYRRACLRALEQVDTWIREGYPEEVLDPELRPQALFTSR